MEVGSMPAAEAGGGWWDARRDVTPLWKEHMGVFSFSSGLGTSSTCRESFTLLSGTKFLLESQGICARPGDAMASRP